MGSPLDEFQACGALRKGHFRLTSGLHSGTYLQCALVMADPARASRLVGFLAGPWKEAGATCVIGPAVGGILVAYELARQLAARTLYSERENGAMTLRRGFEIRPDDKVLLCEDVVTTGGSLREILQIAKGAGAQILGVAALVDRTGGSQPDLRLHAALALSPPTWTPETCPLCKEGRVLDAPGSRYL